MSHSITPREEHAASRYICPRCNGAVKRIQRRRFDRFINFFLPLYRYRCISLGCDWEGNLPSKRKLRSNDEKSDDTKRRNKR